MIKFITKSGACLFIIALVFSTSVSFAKRADKQVYTHGDYFSKTEYSNSHSPQYTKKIRQEEEIDKALNNYFIKQLRLQAEENGTLPSMNMNSNGTGSVNFQEPQNETQTPDNAPQSQLQQHDGANQSDGANQPK